MDLEHNWIRHWVSFPIGFGVFWTIFSNIDNLGAKISSASPTSTAFFLLFAHVCLPNAFFVPDSWCLIYLDRGLWTHLNPINTIHCAHRSRHHASTPASSLYYRFFKSYEKVWAWEFLEQTYQRKPSRFPSMHLTLCNLSLKFHRGHILSSGGLTQVNVVLA